MYLTLVLPAYAMSLPSASTSKSSTATPAAAFAPASTSLLVVTTTYSVHRAEQVSRDSDLFRRGDGRILGASTGVEGKVEVGGAGAGGDVESQCDLKNQRLSAGIARKAVVDSCTFDPGASVAGSANFGNAMTDKK